MAMALHCAKASWSASYTSYRKKRERGGCATSWNVLSRGNSRPFRSIPSSHALVARLDPACFAVAKTGETDVTRSSARIARYRNETPLSSSPPLSLSRSPFLPRPTSNVCLLRCVLFLQIIGLVLLIDSRRFNRYLITSQPGRSV